MLGLGHENDGYLQTKTAIASSPALLSSNLPDFHLGHEYLTKGIKSVVIFKIFSLLSALRRAE